MAEYVGQSLSHSVIAACTVEALVRLWRVREPDLRVAFRVLPLAFPLLVLPLFLLLAPWRSDAAFRDRWALFAGSRWADVRVFAVGVDRAAVATLAVFGVGILLADVGRILGASRAARATLPRLGPEETGALVDEVAGLARALDAPIPGVTALDTARPILFVTGVCRPALVVSRGVLERLDAGERRAALAHEVAHVARRDSLTGWALLACRVALAFNPAVQIVARTAVRELEWRADELAARASGDRRALASALTKLAGTPGCRPSPAAASRLARRRQRLDRAGQDGASSLGLTRLAGTAAGLALLLFFVV